MAPSCMLDYALLGKFTASTPRVLPNVGCFIHRKFYSGPAEKETMFLQTWLLVIVSDIVVQRSYIFYSNLHNKVIKLTEKHNIHNILKNYKNNSIQNLVPSIPQQYIVQMVLLLEVINIHAKLLLSDCALCLQPGRRKLQSYTDVLLISTCYS